ncbi:GntR family transcriptional regulator [Herbiconiux sp. KACC 21604]|uniref:GntR family transcriptional regulator n=1 Tax=unclassified Herbiconiux TaxID=2618217 RepID=UPI00149102B5|nr:GntR family transcriptional regulator [Herbiconiux sp. SALV-R1]QJU53466.1 GntR family transcriptional regulator [Herbiconiux sp. SALV-R1]WPO88438.1 GntR family transcriptional regulator [Herbiconiux sp. KACC 21604]
MVTPSSIAGDLRDDILEMRVDQDQPLREIAIAERFGASRRSVREALLALAQEGVVVHERHRGARVRRFTTDDVRDLYAARTVLEEAGARACPAAPDAAIDAVQLALAELRRAAEEGQDTSRHAAADTAFHAAVIALAGSPRLDGFFLGIRTEMTYAIRLLQRREVASGWGDAEALHDHELIASAVAERDADRAVTAVLDHIRVNEERLRRIANDIA